MILAKLDVEKQKKAHPDIIEPEFWEIVALVWDCTVCGTAVLYNLYCSLKYVFENDIGGDFIECGVYWGGCTMMMEVMCRRHDLSKSRKVFALDTFSGFVRRTDELDVDIRTGKAACAPNPKQRDFSGKSIANMKSIGFDRLEIVRGDVLETIPGLDVDGIAVLRLDTDTYDTTKFELENLYDRVSVGGVVIIDDYGYTFGCKKAVDDFARDRRIFPQRINSYCRTWVKTLSN